MIFLVFLSFFYFSIFPVSDGQLSAYSAWTPTVMRYCETIGPATTAVAPYLLSGGITCGYASYYSMVEENRVTGLNLEITSTISLGLINVAWITTEALKNQTGFWNTCKPYLIRLFDGLYQDATKPCALMVNPPTTAPNCTQDYTNLLLRSGSGYCMREKVCGAFATIDFLAGPDNSTFIYSWTTTNTNALIAQGFRRVGNCYGYSKVLNTNRTPATMETADSQFY